ncbi:MAG TPA: hypothetical protein VFV63_17320 [Ilumatobacteraceae bacterium]|nr:hypothetical protein [Ilumatobacteraceae bacterium]
MSNSSRYRFRSPVSLIDWLVIALGGLGLVAGLIALLGSLYTSGGSDTLDALDRRSGTVAQVELGRELRGWQLAAWLTAFAVLVASNFAAAHRVRRVSSLLTLGGALTGFVAWWWTELGALLGQTYLDRGHVALSGAIVFTGIALGLQVAVGVLMFMAAFPFSAEASAHSAA